MLIASHPASTCAPRRGRRKLCRVRTLNYTVVASALVADAARLKPGARYGRAGSSPVERTSWCQASATEFGQPPGVSRESITPALVSMPKQYDSHRSHVRERTFQTQIGFFGSRESVPTRCCLTQVFGHRVNLWLSWLPVRSTARQYAQRVATKANCSARSGLKAHEERRSRPTLPDSPSYSVWPTTCTPADTIAPNYQTAPATT